MRLRNRGTIVQVGSALTYRSIPLQSAHCAAKHAVAGFTDSLRCELIHQHSRIHVTMVQMPALNTPQFSWVKSRLQRRPHLQYFNPKWPRERFIGLRIIAGVKLALGRSAHLWILTIGILGVTGGFYAAGRKRNRSWHDKIKDVAG